MPVYKDSKTNTWYVKGRYKDWTGKVKYLTKRGFTLKREAVEWETQFHAKQDCSLDMTFSAFYDLYKEDVRPRLKESTWATKSAIIEEKILPFFGDLKMRDISSVNVIRWQNEMMRMKTTKGKPYSETYLKTLHNQLSAIFNHACKFYGLSENPARIAGAMGTKEGQEMNIWSKEEYQEFSEAIMDKPMTFYAFEMLYWCGLREGELLALTREDFDLEKGTVSITKTYHRLKGKDVITPPKTKQSIRTVAMPGFLRDEMKDYFSMIYQGYSGDRAFPVTKYYLNHELKRGIELSGVKKIRVHDLRHSHVSLLIHMGYSAVEIAKRVGHKSIDITFRYAHLYPTVQKKIVDDLDKLRGGADHV